MDDGPLVAKYSVKKKGMQPDPPGACYFVLDYVNDPYARIPAINFARMMRIQGQVVIAEALMTSLEGGEEDAVLRTYEVERNIGQEKPGARYVILNYTHNYGARVALRMYAIACAGTHPQLSESITQDLEVTAEGFRVYTQSKNPQEKKRKGKRR